MDSLCLYPIPWDSITSKPLSQTRIAEIRNIRGTRLPNWICLIVRPIFKFLYYISPIYPKDSTLIKSQTSFINIYAVSATTSFSSSQKIALDLSEIIKRYKEAFVFWGGAFAWAGYSRDRFKKEITELWNRECFTVVREWVKPLYFYYSRRKTFDIENILNNPVLINAFIISLENYGKNKPSYHYLTDTILRFVNNSKVTKQELSDAYSRGDDGERKLLAPYIFADLPNIT